MGVGRVCGDNSKFSEGFSFFFCGSGKSWKEDEKMKSMASGYVIITKAFLFSFS